MMPRLIGACKRTARLPKIEVDKPIRLDECHERVFSSDAGVEQVVLGLYIVRGDNMCVLCQKH